MGEEAHVSLQSERRDARRNLIEKKANGRFGKQNGRVRRLVSRNCAACRAKKKKKKRVNNEKLISREVKSLAAR